ncbi:hypothetical protein EMPS_02149 [Entomortierella parvispora]|uniref:Uncharacterized protein n=1 Tax=Entomortierella parvispora TaxID=205924 RepID=A0A9P3H4E6_9FUNG|nr:hypothetical protein EMPS_02149 [Entomortierella parvispora]
MDMTIATTARRTYNAAMTKVFAQNQIQATAKTTASTRLPFRPTDRAANSTTQAQKDIQDPSSITGLRFCLHMVAFATPGVFLAKKLSDGENLPDMIQQYKETASRFVDNFR